MTVTTALAVGDIYSHVCPFTKEIRLSEIIRIEGNTVVYAETLNVSAVRVVGYVHVNDIVKWTYVGTVRPSSDRVTHLEDGDLFVYTYEGRGSAHTHGNTFVLEITHAYVPGDPHGVRGNIHAEGGYYESPDLPPLRFEREHLNDFAYLGKIDNGTRDGKVRASEKSITEDVSRATTDQAPEQAAGPSA